MVYDLSVGNTRVPLKSSGRVYPVKTLPFGLHFAGDGAGAGSSLGSSFGFSLFSSFGVSVGFSSLGSSGLDSSGVGSGGAGFVSVMPPPLAPAPVPGPILVGGFIGVVVLPPPGSATVTAQEESVIARKVAAASVEKKPRKAPGWFRCTGGADALYLPQLHRFRGAQRKQMDGKGMSGA